MRRIFYAVRVHSAESLRNMLENSNDLNDFEHVGSPYLNENHHKFKIVELAFKNIENYRYRLTVDRKEDLKIAKIIYENPVIKISLSILISVINWLDSLILK